MLRIITRLQLYLLGHYFMTLPLVRMECRLGKKGNGIGRPARSRATNMDFIIRKFAPNFHHLMLLDKQQQQNSWMISGGGRAAGRPSEISLSAVITAKLFPNFADSLIRASTTLQSSSRSLKCR